MHPSSEPPERPFGAQYLAALQVLVEYQEWGDLVDLGLRHPGERGKNLEDVLRALVKEADKNPSGNSPQYIRRVLDDIAQENSLSEVCCWFCVYTRP
jgi:uncharacterized protein YigA (DUF484 family)